MSKVVRLIWKCPKPNDPNHVQLCETLMKKAAQKYNMDTAVVRQVDYCSFYLMLFIADDPAGMGFTRRRE